ncbi:MFS transporter [Rhodococcus electrodiphilus]|uniref:MFS transporter n=1 Tax=Rhodococcus ruber TaxID=1830 RepID=UPI0026F45889|nr:MFS transporter [Rhodococcus ruber]MDO2378172.1 MFS transporter [Rhodococcus ruber]
MTLTDRAQTPRQTTSVVPVCAAAGFTTLLDSSVLNIGLPALRTGLDAGVSQVQWILAAYSLSFGLALVPAGRLGDVAGRRRLFLAGMTLFAVMGVCGAVASDPWTVVAARAGQGVGAGLISAQVLGPWPPTARPEASPGCAVHSSVGWCSALHPGTTGGVFC